MMSLIVSLFGKVIRWVIYLAITGELVSCTIYMKENAYKSVSGGLISLQSINGSLNIQNKK